MSSKPRIAASIVIPLALACSPADTPPAPPSQPLFHEAAAETGLIFHHFIGASGEYYIPEIMGSGVALIDHDQDGDLDVYFTQGEMIGAGDPLFPPRMPIGNRLFENRIIPDGKLTFQDATEASGLTFEGYAMGAAVGDYDQDGDPDLYVTAFGPNALFRNNGDGTFERLDDPQDERWSASAVFVDYDSDRDLDLFFVNYIDFTPRGNKQCFTPAGAADYCNPVSYNPVPDRLFRNDDGRFVDATQSAGLDAAFGNGLGVVTADFDNNGAVDFFVANDGTANQLWLNREGRFQNEAMLAGTAYNVDGRAEAGMGVLAVDFDHDGDEDLLLTHNMRETNTLYLNNGGGVFSDATNSLGLAAPSIPFSGFGLVWADFDHDGSLDIFIANGAVGTVEAERGSAYPYAQHNQFYRRQGQGFEAAAGPSLWGELEPLVSRGAAAGDIDLDGDVDVVVSNNNGPARLYLNQTDDDRWLRIKLRGADSNLNGLGARVGLHLADGSTLWRRLHRDGSYLSSGEPAVHFGLGDHEAQSIEVRWPNGKRETYEPPAAAATVTLEEASVRASATEPRPPESGRRRQPAATPASRRPLR